MNAPLTNLRFINFADVKQHARYQWPAILAGHGLDPVYLRNRHGPCPVCGGKDRFRFDDKDGNGGYYCNGCGAGDGFSLLEKVHGWTVQEALQAVARWLGIAEYGPTSTKRITPLRPSTSPTKATMEEMQAKIRAIWNSSIPLESPKAKVGCAYLDYRGLSHLFPLPNDVRLHPALPYWFPGLDGRSIELGRYPALVALVRAITGEVRGLHRTYLQQDGHGKARVLSPANELLPAKKLLSISPGATRGCAIKLYPLGEEKQLAVAEGIETALAVSLANPDWPCWAAMFAGNLAQFELPAGVETLAICMDNDSNQVGQKAGKALARRLFRMDNHPVIKLMIPNKPDTDWLDVWGGKSHG